MRAFCYIALCSLIGVYPRFTGVYCLHHQGDDLMFETAFTSEMSVYFNETTWHYIPESCHLQAHCHENLKSYKV
jgi:hypothetical protein